jgi:hypothetical protein
MKRLFDRKNYQHHLFTITSNEVFWIRIDFPAPGSGSRSRETEQNLLINLTSALQTIFSTYVGMFFYLLPNITDPHRKTLRIQNTASLRHPFTPTKSSDSGRKNKRKEDASIAAPEPPQNVGLTFKDYR